MMAPTRLIKNIAFFGFADYQKNDKEYQEAFETARFLAEKGYTIINGGGPGVMNASTQGAESVGGETLTITFSPKDAPGFEGRYVANRADREIVTGNYIERMFKLLEHADCFVIFNGGTGTISEFGTAWVLAKLYYPNYKPIILFGDFWSQVIEVIRKKMKIRKEACKVFKIVKSKEEVIKAIKLFEKEMIRLRKVKGNQANRKFYDLE